MNNESLFKSNKAITNRNFSKCSLLFWRDVTSSAAHVSNHFIIHSRYSPTNLYAKVDIIDLVIQCKINQRWNVCTFEQNGRLFMESCPHFFRSAIFHLELLHSKVLLSMFFSKFWMAWKWNPNFNRMTIFCYSNHYSKHPKDLILLLNYPQLTWLVLSIENDSSSTFWLQTFIISENIIFIQSKCCSALSLQKWNKTSHLKCLNWMLETLKIRI